MKHFAVLVLALNIYSTSLSARVQIIFTIAKVLALTIIIVGGVVMMIQGNVKETSKGNKQTIAWVECNKIKSILSCYPSNNGHFNDTFFGRPDFQEVSFIS